MARASSFENDKMVDYLSGIHRIGVVSAAGGTTTWMSLELSDGGEHYIARMEWAACSSELVVQRIPREQKVNDVLLCDVATGNSEIVLSEVDDCWVQASDNLSVM